jgi:hypothetical protein
MRAPRPPGRLWKSSSSVLRARAQPGGTVLCGSPPVQHGSPGGGRHALFIAVERGCRNLWCGDCAVARRGRGPVASAAPTTTTEKSLTLRSLVGLS